MSMLIESKSDNRPPLLGDLNEMLSAHEKFSNASHNLSDNCPS